MTRCCWHQCHYRFYLSVRFFLVFTTDQQTRWWHQGSGWSLEHSVETLEKEVTLSTRLRLPLVESFQQSSFALACFWRHRPAWTEGTDYNGPDSVEPVLDSHPLTWFHQKAYSNQSSVQNLKMFTSLINSAPRCFNVLFKSADDSIVRRYVSVTLVCA